LRDLRAAWNRGSRRIKFLFLDAPAKGRGVNRAVPYFGESWGRLIFCPRDFAAAAWRRALPVPA
jgi:hypothetical protein